MNDATSVKAHFDGEQIVLDEPLELPRDTPLMVTILSDAWQETARWQTLSIRELARAYGKAEPEYSVADIVSE